MPRRRKSLSARFWAKVERSEGCWNWIGATSQGWAIINVEGYNERAHRVSWRLAKGPLPMFVHLRHLCGNQLCVRPHHLELVAGPASRRPRRRAKARRA